MIMKRAIKTIIFAHGKHYLVNWSEAELERSGNPWSEIHEV